jgi:hypothetical protein
MSHEELRRWDTQVARLARTTSRDVTIELEIDIDTADVVSALESEEGQAALRRVEEGE